MFLPRSIALLALIVASAAVALPAGAQDSPAPSTPSPDAAAPESESLIRDGTKHLVGLRFDVGSSTSFGAGYLYGRQDGIMFYGLGADAHLVTDSFDAVDALVGTAAGRLIIGHAPPVGLEVAAGVASDLRGGVQGVGHVGAFVSMGYYFEIGYSYQFPLGPFQRPEWLASHRFSLRGNIPLG